jgi:hypothetical protein
MAVAINREMKISKISNINDINNESNVAIMAKEKASNEQRRRNNQPKIMAIMAYRRQPAISWRQSQRAANRQKQ